MVTIVKRVPISGFGDCILIAQNCSSSESHSSCIAFQARLQGIASLILDLQAVRKIEDKNILPSIGMTEDILNYYLACFLWLVLPFWLGLLNVFHYICLSMDINVVI